MHDFNNIFDRLYYVIGDDPLDTCQNELMRLIMRMKNINDLGMVSQPYLRCAHNEWIAVTPWAPDRV